MAKQNNIYIICDLTSTELWYI